MTQGRQDQPHPMLTLSNADAAAVDAILSRRCGETRHVGSADVAGTLGVGEERADPARLERAAKVCDLIGLCPAEPRGGRPSDLTARTLARLDEIREQQRMTVQRETRLIGGSTRWVEAAAVMVVMLIGASMLWPAIDRGREDARRTACASGLGAAGEAVGQYASDHQEVTPRAGTWPGAVWWNVGQQARDTAHDKPIESNSAHLFTLVRGGYINPARLNCPDNPDAISPRSISRDHHDWPSAKAVSYSYQNQYTPQPIKLSRTPSRALLADKNPLFVSRGDGVGLAFASSLPADAASRLHRQTGQNILLGHGGVNWSRQPILAGGDNIWLANGVKEYHGTEVPDIDDSFLVP